jgi:tetratricopeptide (TPR) repeat protein
MKAILSTAVLAVLLGTPAILTPEAALAHPAAAAKGQTPAVQKSAGDAAAASDVYYYFTLGHLQEQEFETNGDSNVANQSIASYQKALQLDPNSSTIMVRLAEIYAESQRIRDAVTEAQQALKGDPDDVDAHRLLARIYVQALGDIDAGDVQQANVGKAVTEFQAILKVEPDDVTSSLWLARLYRFQNKQADAETILRGLLHRDPDEGQALEQLSQILIDEGRSQEAIELLKQAAVDSSSADVYDLLGDAYTQAKDYPNAEDAYRNAIEQDPDDPGHRHGLAQALVAEEKYADAVVQYKKLTELEPGTADNHLRLAELYRHLGQFDNAQASLEQAQQLAPGSLEVLYNQALLYGDQGRYDDAVKVLNDAIAGTKKQAGASTNPSALTILYDELGRTYRRQGNYAGAIQTYQEMAKLGPESEKHAEMLLIETYRDSHDIDHAIAETKKALGESPNDQTLTIMLAMLYGDKPDPAQATQILQPLLHGTGEDQEIYIDMAQVQQRGKKYADAEQSAQKAEQIAQDPSDKQSAWFMLGAIYSDQKKFDQAEVQFRKVIDANPNNASALNYLGYMLADRGIRLDEATSLIQRALKQDPENYAYLDSMGWAYYKQNKLAEAEEFLQKAVNGEGHDPTILSHLGNVYLKLGNNERAADLFERSLAEWQKALPADYEADKVNELDAQLKVLKRRLAEKSTPDAPKPQ